MNAIRFYLLVTGLLVFVSVHAANWPAWRGPTGDGICWERGLPVTWSRTDSVKWRMPLPEPGNSTPVIWGDRVFLTQAEGNRRTVMGLDRSSGRQLWQQGVTTKLDEAPTHRTNPYCASSAVTDGERVVAWFGSDGLHCFDIEGSPLWSVDLGIQRHIWGYGSSPVIVGDLCFLNFGPGDANFLIAVDKATGKERWRHDEETGYGKPPTPEVRGSRPGQPATYIGSWTTPVVMEVEGERQLLMSWPRRLAAYDLASGMERWTCSGLTPLVYTSPIFSDGIVVSMSGFSGSAMAMKAGGSGDVTEARRLWRHDRSPQRIGSGVVHDGHIYIHNDPGTAMCLDLETGENVWTETLQGEGPTKQNWSSVMLADGLCYTINHGGDCFVFKASPTFELISINPLGERSHSSIAPSDGDLFIRTHEALWCIGAD